jgi:hypothetical protein
VSALKPSDNEMPVDSRGTNPSSEPQPRIVQSAPRGIAIAGDNNGIATVNNYGPSPLSINKAQMDAVSRAVAPHSGARADICWEYGSPETDVFVHNLQKALEAGGLVVEMSQAMMTMGPPGIGRVTSGLAFAFPAGDMVLTQAVADALVNNGYPAPNRQFRGAILPEPRPCDSRMHIYVGSRQ